MKNRLGLGFTLIELLLAIAILSILSGVTIAVLNPKETVGKGRDARRMQDLDNMYKAVYLAMTNEDLTLTNTELCTDCSSSTGSRAVDGTGFIKFSIPLGKTGLAKYFPGIPIDPVNDGVYVYTYASDGVDFELNAVLESEANAAVMTTDNGTSQYIYEVGTKLDLL
jgi:prepilin-type N-terminal cleavage/methylation domain-containing protein